MLKKYRHNMLTDDQVRWIVKQRIEGRMKNEDIALVQGISVRRVQQIYAVYRKAGSVPVLKKAGRSKVDITEGERKVIIEAYGQFKSCASYLEHIIMYRYGLKVNRMKINAVLKQEGLAVSEPGKHGRKKWIRYKRDHSDHSNSLWHVDWHEIKDPR